MSTARITVNHDAYVRANFPERPENWKPLNLAQAESLFAEHATLYYEYDVIPYPVAYRLFGWRACDTVDFWIREGKSSKAFQFGQRFGASSHFNRKGVRAIISLLNGECHEAAGKELFEADHADVVLEDERNNAEEVAKRQARREKAAQRKAAKLAAEQAAQAIETAGKGEEA